VPAAAASEGWSTMRASADTGGRTLWIAQLHLDLKHTGFAAEWMNEALITGMTHLQWKGRVATAVHKRESAQWRRTVMQADHPAVYQQVQRNSRELVEATYLRVPTHGWNDQRLLGRKVLTALRTGTAMLRVLTGAWRKETLQQRVCTVCAVRGAVEDERHFLLECEYYSGERRQLFDCITRIVRASSSDTGSSTDTETGVRAPAAHRASIATFDMSTLAPPSQLHILLISSAYVFSPALSAAAQRQLHSAILLGLAHCWRKRHDFVSCDISS
jgi:hypothetical protein